MCYNLLFYISHILLGESFLKIGMIITAPLLVTFQCTISVYRLFLEIQFWSLFCSFFVGEFRLMLFSLPVGFQHVFNIFEFIKILISINLSLWFKGSRQILFLLYNSCICDKQYACCSCKQISLARWYLLLLNKEQRLIDSYDGKIIWFLCSHFSCKLMVN